MGRGQPRGGWGYNQPGRGGPRHGPPRGRGHPRGGYANFPPPRGAPPFQGPGGFPAPNFPPGGRGAAAFPPPAGYGAPPMMGGRGGIFPPPLNRGGMGGRGGAMGNRNAPAGRGRGAPVNKNNNTDNNNNNNNQKDASSTDNKNTKTPATENKTNDDNKKTTTNSGAVPAKIPEKKKQKPEKVGDWLVWKDQKTGKSYYQNTKTKQITWKQPKEVSDKDPTERAWKMCDKLWDETEKDNWVEYKTKEGVSFYTNIVTRKNTFERPPELDAVQKVEPAKSVYIDPETLKNSIPSQRKNKEKFKEITTHASKPKGRSWVNNVKSALQGLAGDGTSKIIRKKKVTKKQKYDTKEERVDAFKDLLKDKGLGEKDKFDKFLRKIIADPRYRAITSHSERKKIFSEFQDELADRKHQERKEAKKKLKSNFMELLKESSDVKPGARFRRVEPILEGDERWKAVRHSDDRERWFFNYIEELERQQAEKRRLAQSLLKELLQNTKEITYNSTYREAEKMFAEDEVFNDKNLSGDSRRQTFRDYVDRLKKEHGREQEKKRKERLHREEVEDRKLEKLLSECCYEKNPPLFHSKTQFEDLLKIDSVINDERYEPYKEAPRSDVAFKKFDQFCWRLNDKLHGDKKAFKSILRKKEITPTADDEVNEYETKHKEVFEDSKIKEAHLRLLIFEYIAKAQHKRAEKQKYAEEKEEKRKKKRKRSMEAGDSSSRKKRKKKHKKRSKSKSRSRSRSRKEVSEKDNDGDAVMKEDETKEESPEAPQEEPKSEKSVATEVETMEED